MKFEFDKKKFEKFKVEAKERIENGCVKAIAFCQKHPVASTIGGSVISAVVAGGIGKAAGYKRGYNDRNQEFEDVVKAGTPDKGAFWGYKRGDRIFKNENNDVMKLVDGAKYMNLEEGEYVTLTRQDNALYVNIDPKDETKRMIDDFKC